MITGYHDTDNLINPESEEPKKPTVWGFVLVILGTVLVVCVFLGVVYWMMKRRRRAVLQRMLEVNGTYYERYGLQSVKISQEFLASLPVYVYLGQQKEEMCDQPSWPKAASRSIEAIPARTEKEGEVQTEPQRSSSTSREDVSTGRHPKMPGAQIEGIAVRSSECASPTPPPTTGQTHADRRGRIQPTCAICLDDFVPASTTVRELPCGHIYHPRCIDLCLTQTSSLCPLCKKCVLPPDYYAVAIPEPIYRRDGRRL